MPQKYKKSLEIKKVSNKLYSWIINYEGEASRKYELLKVENRPDGHWLLDEKNGIFIDMFISESKMSSLFTINQKIFVTEDILQDSSITSRTSTYFIEGARTSTLKSNAKTVVSSYSSYFSTSCHLEKIDQ